MENWDEVRTAFQVARMGTVSGAAEVLGVHHATVIRHIDALEKRLGTKLFQRHARGYTPTEAGRDLMTVAKTTEEQFGQLSSRIKGQGEVVAGELVVTSITGMGSLLSPVFASYTDAHPQVIIRFITDMRVFRLDYGEAHVAIRAGSAPQEPDNVVQPLMRMRSALYAARSYVDRHGLPAGPQDFGGHYFVGTDASDARAPFHKWLLEHVPVEAIRFRINDPSGSEAAVKAGLGIGFLGWHDARNDPDLVEVMAPRTEWDAPLWIVTHVDLHRTLKVQSFLTVLKAAATQWSNC